MAHSTRQARRGSVSVCTALAALAPWIAIACGPEPRARESAAGAILIGELQSLSGPLAARGEAFHRGFTRAIDERNTQGGIRGRAVEVQVYDDRSRAEDAALGAARLVGEQRVVLVFGGSSPELLRAIASASGDVPLVSPFGAGLAQLGPVADGGARGDADAPWVVGPRAPAAFGADGEALGRACGELACAALERTRTFEPFDLWRALAAQRSVLAGESELAVVDEDEARAFEDWWRARERARAAAAAAR